MMPEKYTYIVTGSENPERYHLFNKNTGARAYHFTREEIDRFVAEIEKRGHVVRWQLGGLHLEKDEDHAAE